MKANPAAGFIFRCGLIPIGPWTAPGTECARRSRLEHTAPRVPRMRHADAEEECYG